MHDQGRDRPGAETRDGLDGSGGETRMVEVGHKKEEEKYTSILIQRAVTLCEPEGKVGGGKNEPSFVVE